MLFTCGWTIMDADEDAIRQVPAAAWQPGIAQDGGAEDDKDVAEITRPDDQGRELAQGCAGSPAGSSRRAATCRNLTDYEKENRLEVLHHCTNIPDAAGSPAFPAATTPSTSTSCTASTPSSRRGEDE